MSIPPVDPTLRFSDRVENYIQFRPHYPKQVLEVLHDESGLNSTSVVADVGSGTGISSELFLQNGNTVFGVEPNSQMRQAAEAWLGRYPRFHSIEGTAEATTLPGNHADYVVAAQAFHWFESQRARTEFARILRPNGWLALLWNSRRTDSTPFLRDYETLLQTFATDYKKVNHRNVTPTGLANVFADKAFRQRIIYNEQRFDFAGLKGRLLSSSYAPLESHANHERMFAHLQEIFDRHAVDGQVCFEYDLEIYVGHVA